MKAYKAFDEDLKCRGFQYDVGKEYQMDEDPVLCGRGYHACKKLGDVFGYYDFSPETRICEVELLGDVKKCGEDSKLVTNHIKIIKELSHEELGLAGECRLEFTDQTSHYKDYKLHREGGPAIECANGTKEWWIDDKQHREDGPAIEWADGSKWWYIDGKRHREDGPAIERASGSKEWWIDGKRHREDGPAIEWADGTKEWWIDGKLHREDGPAIEWANGTKEWWVNGRNYYESV